MPDPPIKFQMSTTTANDTTDTNNESKIDKSFTESASTAIKSKTTIPSKDNEINVMHMKQMSDIDKSIILNNCSNNNNSSSISSNSDTTSNKNQQQKSRSILSKREARSFSKLTRSRFNRPSTFLCSEECLTLDTQRPVVTSVAITPELIRRRQQRTRVNAEQLDPVGHFLIQEKSIKSLSSNFTSKATKQQEQQQYKQQNPDDETRGNSRSSEADNKNLFLSNTKLQQLACEKTILSAIIDLRSRLKLPIVTIITCVALGFVTLIWKKLNNH